MSKILVVEDDPELRELIQFYLQRDQFQVLLAEVGVEAFHFFHFISPILLYWI